MYNNKDDGFEPDLSDPQSLPQFRKKYYYSNRNIPLSELSSNAEFKQYIDDLMNFNKEKTLVLEQKPEIGNDPDVEEFSAILNKLAHAVEDGVLANQKLATSIVALRESYSKLNQAQKTAFISDNPFLKVEIQDLEEKLIETGLINPLDIIDPETFTNNDKKLETASRIYRNILVDSKAEVFDPVYFTFYSKFGLINQTKPKQDASFKLSEYENTLSLSQLSDCVASLAKVASAKNTTGFPLKAANKEWDAMVKNPGTGTIYDLESNNLS